MPDRPQTQKKSTLMRTKKNRRKSGRNRSTVDRAPNGQPQRTYGRDAGTKETLARREKLELRRDGTIGDMTKTTTPLDILYSNGTIDAIQWKAGTKFASCTKLSMAGPMAAHRPAV